MGQNRSGRDPGDPDDDQPDDQPDQVGAEHDDRQGRVEPSDDVARARDLALSMLEKIAAVDIARRSEQVGVPAGDL